MSHFNIKKTKNMKMIKLKNITLVSEYLQYFYLESEGDPRIIEFLRDAEALHPLFTNPFFIINLN